MISKSNHNQKTEKICRLLKERKSTAPLSLKKKTVSHLVPFPKNLKYSDEKIDISDLNEIILVDTEEKICIAEPGVTFSDLVKATLKNGLVPMTVPEEMKITIGGAVAGGSLESMSYKYGGFHDSCLEYEVINAKGGIITCSPEENNLLFQMLHSTFGTLGIISMLKFRLVPAKQFVHLVFKKYYSLKDYFSAIHDIYEKKNVDFVDGLIYSPEEQVLCIGTFVDKAPYTHNYSWTRVFFQHAKKREDDYLKTTDYFFRYDKGTTTTLYKSFLGRLLFNKFSGTANLAKIADIFHKFIPSNSIPIIIDVFIPSSKVEKFLEWYTKEYNYYPLWCVPYKMPHRYEWISQDFARDIEKDLVIDLAVYDLKTDDNKKFYRKIEEKLIEIGGIKTLIANNYYSEPEFWSAWNKENYFKIKKSTDPDNTFRDLFEKTCRMKMGIKNS